MAAVTRLGLSATPRAPYGSFDGKAQPSVQVVCTLVNRNGASLPDLSALSWAWFDSTDPATFSTPTDQGETETTDSAAEIVIPLPGSNLSSGEFGFLILMSDDGLTMGAYKLAVSNA